MGFLFMKKKRIYHLDMVFFCTFFLGILLANLLQGKSKNRFFMLNEYYLQQFKYTKINTNQFFFYVVENRLPIFALLLLLSFTVVGILTHIVFVSYYGLSFGFLCVMAITNFGWKGFFYVIGFLFPHYLLYLFCYLLFLKIFYRKKEGQHTEQKTMILQIGVVLILFLIGMLLEGYVNPVLLSKILKIF